MARYKVTYFDGTPDEEIDAEGVKDSDDHLWIDFWTPYGQSSRMVARIRAAGVKRIDRLAAEN